MYEIVVARGSAMLLLLNNLH